MKKKLTKKELLTIQLLAVKAQLAAYIRYWMANTEPNDRVEAI